MKKTSDSSGFTLLELLIALFVFALMSGFAYRAVNVMVKSSESVAEDDAALVSFQRAFLLLERDLRQAIQIGSNADSDGVFASDINEPVDGDALLLVGSGGLGDEKAESFIRYIVRDNKLVKEKGSNFSTEPALDSEVSLMDGVVSLSHEYISNSGAGDSDIKNLPLGLVVKLQHEQLGVVERTIGFGAPISELTSNEILALNTLEPAYTGPTTVGGKPPEEVDEVSDVPVINDYADSVADSW